MENNLVSIILPTYNRGEKCINVINDILNQSYTNIELIIINDGSNEYNTIILETFLNNINNSKINYIKQENKGLAISLNIGLLNITGDYFTWLSDDNKIYNNFIQDLLLKDSDFTYSNYTIQTDTKKKQIPNNHNGIKDLINNFKGMASFMWKKDIIDKIGYFNKSLSGLCEDFDYEIRTFLATKNIIHINNYLIDFYEGPDTQSSINYILMKKTHSIVSNFYNIYINKLSYQSNIVISYISKDILYIFNDSYSKIFISDIDNDLYYNDKDKFLIVPVKYKELIYNILCHCTNKHKLKHIILKEEIDYDKIKKLDNVKIEFK